MGKIVKDRYPELSVTDQEAVRQHAIAALNLTQQAKAMASEMEEQGETKGGSAFVDSVRRYVMSVRDLNIDLIDKINPFGVAYSILAKSMDPAVFKQVAAVIAAKRITLTLDEARALAKRALQFKKERGRLPDITSPDAWEKRMAEGVAFLQRHATAAAHG
jgi:hypothetical protein